MKQWRKLLLVALLAWLLLFLSLLSHFLDLRSSVAPRTRSLVPGPTLTRTEIRRLASVQGGKGSPGASSSAPGSSWGERRAGPRGEGLNGEPGEGSVAALKDAGRGRNPTARSPEEDWEERRRRRKMSIRGRRGRMWSLRSIGGAAKRVEEEEEEEEDNYVSMSKVVGQRLWKGNASAGMLSQRLQKAMMNYLSSNKHRVAYRGPRRGGQSGHKVLCQLKKQAKLKTLDGSEEPFASLGWDKLVPSRPLEQLQGSEFNSCAVVTSAGAILNSFLGKEIDSHDAVLRFNTAPTKGFEKDVGSKTTIRIINSQILARPRHHFNSSCLYQNVTLVAWDPAPYSVDLPTWYEKPDYDLFTPYRERRRGRPDQPFYILHPGYIWRLWDVIQANTQENIQPNPPSSGFIDSYG
ncbi:beta-galactoside alpha-2,6-sialyltransferase 2-like isoform 2-T4 [Polymixia lowei]